MWGRRLVLLGVAASALLVVLGWSGGHAFRGGTQELLITASDGAKLSCALVEPDASPPAGGFPAMLLFHGLGGSHADMEPLAEGPLASSGYASLMCDARGTGASEGLFDLDGPRTVQDVRDLFAWLAARPEISDTEIGAFGLSLGGGAVWNAAAAGVPFAAIVPMITWTNLSAALVTQGLPKSGLVSLLSFAVPTSRWEPDVLAAAQSLEQGTVTPQVTALEAARSPKPSTITVPTLLVQGRHDFLFDEAQAKSAYRTLAGPHLLYLGDLGHPPATNPPAELPVLDSLVIHTWLDHFVKGAPATVKPLVEIAHDPWDDSVTTYAGIPTPHTSSVSLPGTTTLHAGGSTSRSIRLTGGPHETFGGGTVTVRYSGAHGWDHLVALVSTGGNSITLGGTRLTKPSGVATIKLLDESVLIPLGAKVTLRLGATSGPELAYVRDVAQGSSITLGRATLILSFLQRAVSR